MSNALMKKPCNELIDIEEVKKLKEEIKDTEKRSTECWAMAKNLANRINAEYREGREFDDLEWDLHELLMTVSYLLKQAQDAKKKILSITGYKRMGKWIKEVKK